MNFLALRLDYHAQWEIRVYAEAMANIVKEIVPSAYEAFEDYVLHSKTFSRLELDSIKQAMNMQELELIAISKGLKGRELSEFLAKVSDD